MSEQFVGLDVSQKETHVCVLNEDGKLCWQGRCFSTPEDIAATVKKYAPHAFKVGLETGPLAIWHYHGLKKLGIPVECLCARQTNAALKLQANKTDRNDARGLAEIVRTGWYKTVSIKAMKSYELQSRLVVRSKLVNVRRDLATQIRGLLKTFGFIVANGRGGPFHQKVLDIIEGREDVAVIIRPLLSSWQHLSNELSALDKELLKLARENEDCRLLMTVPGVGPITSLAFVSNVEDADRFSKSSSVGAYFGLTPRRYQSGETDYSGRISKRGDAAMRSYLFEAASVLLTRVRKWSALKAWGMKIARQKGHMKAVVAVARKMAVIMHAMLRDRTEFRWSSGEEGLAA